MLLNAVGSAHHQPPLVSRASAPNGTDSTEAVSDREGPSKKPLCTMHCTHSKFRPILPFMSTGRTEAIEELNFSTKGELETYADQLARSVLHVADRTEAFRKLETGELTNTFAEIEFLAIRDAIERFSPNGSR